ncbi:MAG: hypothetical protein DMF63_07670 [Acidobacteria bacterium]|nr:MAG: hypothetical protein DMF63_07670 [Acidobacteriota bacterium]
MILALFQSVTILFLVGLLVFSFAPTSVSDAIPTSLACPSARSAAKLTGWALNNKNPFGDAVYDESAKSLVITVSNVALPNGTRLSILTGDEKIGEMEPLKEGSARGVVTHILPDNARVRVFSDDRPIVSANLQCSTSPAPVATVVPSPSVRPSPSTSPSVSPSTSPSPGPTNEPTPDPMPKQSPMPSPSPG